ncbi:putative sporulation protein YtxC [Aeribacillus pallidus]|jgi:putative sporulation protein YtxC|uniref:putative sporulation protein YtxC n=1 Tax=Aeribacillus pallidus TaxID=33936 RepID=UPI003D19303A
MVFSRYQDALQLQTYMEREHIPTTIHETLFQQKRTYVLSISFHKYQQKKVELAIYQFLVEQKRKEWIKEIITNCFYFKEEEEIRHIMDIVFSMWMDEREELTSLIERVDETKLLMDAISTLFQQQEPVVFSSFVKFRLKKYYNRLIEYVEVAIDEYKMEQEYQMFIQMLRDYLVDREPRMRVIHLYNEQHWLFYDENYQLLSKKEIHDCVDRRLLTNHPIYIDSATIAPLLSMAPLRIYVYTDDQEDGLIRTIQNIFEERVCILKKDEFWEQYATNRMNVSGN